MNANEHQLYYIYMQVKQLLGDAVAKTYWCGNDEWNMAQGLMFASRKGAENELARMKGNNKTNAMIGVFSAKF